MKTALRVLFSLLVGASAPAMAEPWGWAEGPSGRTPLMDASVPTDATNIVFAAGTVTSRPLALSNRKLSFTAAAGQVLSFGVDPSTFKQYPNSPANWGFVPPANRMFAHVWLFGCVALGADWQLVGEVETDGEGRFTAAVPEGLRFFRLEGEVAR